MSNRPAFCLVFIGVLTVCGQASAQSCLTLGDKPFIEKLSFGTEIGAEPIFNAPGHLINLGGGFSGHELVINEYGYGTGTTKQTRCFRVTDPKDIFEVEAFQVESGYIKSRSSMEWADNPGVTVLSNTGNVNVREGEHLGYVWGKNKCSIRSLPLDGAGSWKKEYLMDKFSSESATLDRLANPQPGFVYKAQRIEFPRAGDYEVICSYSFSGSFKKTRHEITGPTTANTIDYPGYPYGLPVKERASFRFTKKIGGLIDSTISSNVSTGIVPLEIVLGTAINNPSLESLASIKYEKSSDGLRWVPISLDANSKYVVRTGGDNYFRSVVSNKNSKLEKTSAAVKVTTTFGPIGNFAATAQVDSLFAPSTVSIKVAPASSDDLAMTADRVLTYTWNLPNGVVGTTKGNSLTSVIASPGSYDISVVVSDAFGGARTVPYHIDIAEPRPIDLSVNTTLAQRYNRAPAAFSLKTPFTGGHPKDRPTAFRLFVDGTSVPGTQPGRMPGTFKISTGGTHTVKVEMDTKMGNSASKEITLNVPKNTAPSCPALTVVWDSKRTAARITSKCTDSDGLIKDTVWSVDGVVVANAKMPSFTWVKNGAASANIQVKVTDDLGITGTQSITVQ